MEAENRMTIDERYKYLSLVEKRYRTAGKAEQSEMLDEMMLVTGLGRKSLIRRLNQGLVRQQRRRQRSRTYGPEVDDALRVISESLDNVCAERLQPNLVWMAEQLAQHSELVLTDALREQLRTISVSTVQRILQRVRQDEPRLPRRGPEQANRVRRDVPMKRIAWNETQPGHLEADLVHHCGDQASGDFMHTLQLIDVATGWSERVALLGRSYLVMQAAFSHCQDRLPFAVLEIHPDNGSEFFNHHLVRFWKERIRGVVLSRSRPYHKNDNRFVEQKNSSLVRAYLGSERLDSVAQVLAANYLYEQMWVYYNLFQPVMRMVERTTLPLPDGTLRIQRRFDLARTPFDRLSATQAISPADRESLERLRDHTNPRILRQQIYDQIDHLFRLPGAQPGGSEDVFAIVAALAPALLPAAASPVLQPSTL